MDKKYNLPIILDYLKYQLAFEMLANDYAERFIEKEELFMEIGQHQSYWTKEIMETFLSRANEKLIEIVEEVFKGEKK